MRKISMEKVIDGDLILEADAGNSVYNDVFCVDVKYDEYWVFFYLEEFDPIYLGTSSSVSGAVDIMNSFVWGCRFTTNGEIKYD